MPHCHLKSKPAKILCERLLSVLVLLAVCQGLVAQPIKDQKPKPKNPTECLVLPPVGRLGRSAIPVDALLAEIVAGKWTAPKVGDTVTLPGDPVQKWETLKGAADGSFNHPALRGGYAYLAVPAEEEQVVILE